MTFLFALLFFSGPCSKTKRSPEMVSVPQTIKFLVVKFDHFRMYAGLRKFVLSVSWTWG